MSLRKKYTLLTTMVIIGAYASILAVPIAVVWVIVHFIAKFW